MARGYLDDAVKIKDEFYGMISHSGDGYLDTKEKIKMTLYKSAFFGYLGVDVTGKVWFVHRKHGNEPETWTFY
jgi:hypothetical protein